MAEFTYQDLINIHDLVRQRFGINGGVRDPSLVDATAKRPSQGHFGITPFPDVYSKAASIMEAVIRWSPFVDGNKSTALAATSVYLDINGYALVLPISAVRFSIKIAQAKGDDPETVQRLLTRIGQWIRGHSAPKNTRELRRKFNWHLYYPIMMLDFLTRIHLTAVAVAILTYWLALDLYPEHAKEVATTLRFLLDTAKIGVTPGSPPGSRSPK